MFLIFGIVVAVGLAMGAADVGNVDHAGDPTFQCDQSNSFAWNHVCDDSGVESAQEVEAAPVETVSVPDEKPTYDKPSRGRGHKGRGGRGGRNHRGGND